MNDIDLNKIYSRVQIGGSNAAMMEAMIDDLGSDILSLANAIIRTDHKRVKTGSRTYNILLNELLNELSYLDDDEIAKMCEIYGV